MTGPMAAAMDYFGVERRAIRPYDVALVAWIVVLAGVTIYEAATTTGFLTVSNLKAILTAASFVGIIAVGLTVIVSRQPLLPGPRPDRGRFRDGLPLLAPDRSHCRDHPDAGARPCRSGPSRVRGRRLGSRTRSSRSAPRDSWREPPSGSPRGEHRPARLGDELGAPRTTGLQPARPRLRLHRPHGRARPGDAQDALRAADLPPRRESRRRRLPAALPITLLTVGAFGIASLYTAVQASSSARRANASLLSRGATPTTPSPPLSSAATPSRVAGVDRPDGRRCGLHRDDLRHAAPARLLDRSCRSSCAASSSSSSSC